MHEFPLPLEEGCAGRRLDRQAHQAWRDPGCIMIRIKSERGTKAQGRAVALVSLVSQPGQTCRGQSAFFIGVYHQDGAAAGGVIRPATPPTAGVGGAIHGKASRPAAPPARAPRPSFRQCRR